MIACIGNIVADILVKPFDDVPGGGVLKMVDRIQLGLGGCAGNAAAVMGRMGAKVSILCGIGDDSMGRFLVEELEKASVDTRGVKRFDNTKSSASLVCVNSSGERSFLTQFGASKKFSIQDVDWDLIKESRHLHFGGFSTTPNIVGDSASELFRRVKEMGKTISLDTAFDHSGRWIEDLKASLPFIDYLMTNRIEAEHLTGEKSYEVAARELRGFGAKAVIIKLDRDGSYIEGDRIRGRVEAYSVDVVDTTGAGDAFAAGFVMGLDRGLEIRDCLKLGNLLGAICVQRLGTTEAFISKHDVEAFIAEREPGFLKVIAS